MAHAVDLLAIEEAAERIKSLALETPVRKLTF